MCQHPLQVLAPECLLLLLLLPRPRALLLPLILPAHLAPCGMSNTHLHLQAVAENVVMYKYPTSAKVFLDQFDGFTMSQKCRNDKENPRVASHLVLLFDPTFFFS